MGTIVQNHRAREVQKCAHPYWNARHSDTRTLYVSRPTSTDPTKGPAVQVVSRQLVGWSERRDAAMPDLVMDLRGENLNGKISSTGSGKAGGRWVLIRAGMC